MSSTPPLPPEPGSPTSFPPPGPWPPAAPPPGTPAGGPPRPHGSDSFFDSLRRAGVVRANDRWIGGVAAGLARRLGVDPLLVRGAFVVLTLFGGLTLVVYGLAWALLPEESDGRIHLQEAIRGRFDAALAGAAAFVVVGITRPVFWFQPDQWAPGWLIALGWLGLLATVVVVAVVLAGRERPRPPAGPAPYPTSPSERGAPAMSTPTTPPAGPSGSLPPTEPGVPPAGAPVYPAAPPTQGYAPPAQGYTPPPQAYALPPQGYAPPPASGYSPPPVQTYQPPAATAAPAWEPPPPKPRVPGPGAVTVGVTLALCLFGAAAVLLIERTGAFDGGAALVIAGTTLALLGLGVLVSGVRGRRSGVLGGLAVLVALLAVPVALIATTAPHWRNVVSSGGTVVAGDVTWAPTSVADAEAGYSYGVGEASIDLTGVPLAEAGTDPVTVPIESGAGSTTVLVPSGVPLEVRVRLGAGQISTVLVGDWTRSLNASGRAVDAGSDANGDLAGDQISGTNLDLTLRSPAAGDPQMIVTVDAGLGDVTIREALR